MPATFRTARLWTLVTLIVVAVAAGSALRAVQPDTASMGSWPQSSAI